MARGEFKIVKFAFGDEEINYELFNGNHPSGSAFSDIKIMQTPIMEAFTNNTSMMKTKLISLNRNNILFLPVLRVNENPVYTGIMATAADPDGSLFGKSAQTGYTNGWIMLADNTTHDYFYGIANDGNGKVHQGVLHGQAPLPADYRNGICIDQGIETGGKVPAETPMPDDLRETAFLIRVDHRLLRLRITSPTDDPTNSPGPSGAPTAYGNVNLQNSFVDDDAIATYYIPNSQLGPGPQTRASAIAATRGDANQANELDGLLKQEVFNGPLGPRLRIHPRSSLHIQQTDALFDEIGKPGVSDIITSGRTLAAANYKFIDTLINVVGVSTGHSLDLPIRIVKKTS